MKAGDLVSLKSKPWLRSATLWSEDRKKVKKAQGSFSLLDVGVVLQFSKKKESALVLTSAGAIGWILEPLLRRYDRK